MSDSEFQDQPNIGLLKTLGVPLGETTDLFGLKMMLPLLKVFAESTWNHLTQLLETKIRKFENILDLSF
jgi:hypothetical protein